VSDNTVLVTPPNSTNADTIRDLDRGGGIKTPVVQLDVGGASGNAESLVSASNPLPVTGTVVTTPPAHASANIDQIGGAALTEGQKVMAASVPVVIASDQSAVPVSGTVTTTPPADASTNITKVGGAALTEGQKVMAASVPVVIASDQSAVPISAASLPLPAGAAQETGGNLAAIAASVAAQATSDAAQVTQLTALLQLIELNKQILAVLQAIRLQAASAYGVDIAPVSFIDDPTFN
jgi:hypothetical protein